MKKIPSGRPVSPLNSSQFYCSIITSMSNYCQGFLQPCLSSFGQLDNRKKERFNGQMFAGEVADGCAEAYG
jgi:hypothetical protein